MIRIRGAVYAICVVILSALPGRTAAIPLVTVRLAPEIHSEDLNISYVLYGPFGAAGASVTARANVHSYQIRPVHDGKVATSIKAVIYSAGCEFDTLEADVVGDTPIEKSYACVALPTASLVGHIAHIGRFRNRDLEVVVRYLADWECKFFEFWDCMVPQIGLARAPVNENGNFEATFTDFSPERTSPLHHRGELCVILRDAKTWNWIGAGLRPQREFQTRSDTGLAIRPFYPPPVEFEIVSTSNPVPKPPNAGE
jgi:hypothetical protein